MAVNAVPSLLPATLPFVPTILPRKRKKRPPTSAPLIRNSQGINYSLSNLYELLAKNRISPRRASVLAYINSLLLRTLPAIDADHNAGITDPTKPMTETLPVPDSGPVLDLVKTWDPSNPEPDPKKQPS